MKTVPGQVYYVPVSHGEGRFIAGESLLRGLIENGQIATQYCGLDGKPSGEIEHNPNGSVFAGEGLTSPDGRVLGKMGHTERWRPGLLKNVEGDYDMRLFEAAVEYYK
jgi:phosphoribosylformylglycinamidine synthase